MGRGLGASEPTLPVWDGGFMVRDEFAPLRSVLLHDPTNAVDLSVETIEAVVPADELADHPETGPVLRARVREQHARLWDLIDQFGVAAVAPVEQPNAFCQVFTRDPCFVVRDRLFVAALRDEYRRPETAGLISLRRRPASVVSLARPGAALEGGDVFVLRNGDLVLIGTHRHTNASGIAWLAEQLGPVGVQVVPIPHRALHLDCCFAPLPNGEAPLRRASCPRRRRSCSARSSPGSARWTMKRGGDTWRQTSSGSTLRMWSRASPRARQTSCSGHWASASTPWTSRI